MPRVQKALVIDTTLAEPARPKLAPAPVNLDQPDHVACIRCGQQSPSESSKCPGCGLRFDDAAQNTRLNVALKQKLAAGESAQREQVTKSRAVDPDKAASVVGAHALVEAEAQGLVDRMAADVQASKERLEKALAVHYANDSNDTRLALDDARQAALNAPELLALAEAGLTQVRALKPLAEECDQLRASAMSAATFRAELAKRMQAASKHLDAAMAEFAGAYELQREHQRGMSVASNKHSTLDKQLSAIRRSFITRLPHGFYHSHSHEDVSHAAAQALVGAVNGSKIDRALAENLRLNVKWTWQLQ